MFNIAIIFYLYKNKTIENVKQKKIPLFRCQSYKN